MKNKLLDNGLNKLRLLNQRTDLMSKSMKDVILVRKTLNRSFKRKLEEGIDLTDSDFTILVNKLDYDDLYDWSITDVSDFWDSVYQFCDIRFSSNPNTSKLHETPKVSLVLINLLGLLSIFFYKFF